MAPRDLVFPLNYLFLLQKRKQKEPLGHQETKAYFFLTQDQVSAYLFWSYFMLLTFCASATQVFFQFLKELSSFPPQGLWTHVA